MIDAHAHLLSEKLDATEIILNMKDDNLKYIINIGTSAVDSEQGYNLASNNKNIFSTVGIHPEYAKDVTSKDLKKIEELLKNNTNKKIVAVGEIGLDYHYQITDDIKEKQKQLFISQIKLADSFNLPIVIHCRDAVEDVLKILKEYNSYLSSGVCMHCYSEGEKYAKQFIDLGCYLSFTGNITFKKVDRQFLKTLPLDKIMVETDCPYLSPEPVRGGVNVPKNVMYTALKIADTLEMSVQELEKITEQNTKRFFKIG